MSERIKELMAQAGIDVEAVTNLGEMPAALKFAELIVADLTCAIREDALRYPKSDVCWIGAMEESAKVVERWLNKGPDK